MIAQLRGTCVRALDGAVVLDVGGVGYDVRATGEAVRRAVAADGEVTLLIYTHVRDDAIQLFGFATVDERTTFERLIALQGIGPKVAILILSAFDAQSIRVAVERGDVAVFESISGIGPKVARRIVVELAGKLDDIGAGTSFTAEVGDGWLEAREALIGLGLSRMDAEAALSGTDDDAPVDVRVRQALQAVRT